MTIPAERVPPSTGEIAIAAAILVGITGFFIWQASSVGLFGGSTSKSTDKTSSEKQTHSQASGSSSESESDFEELGTDQGDLQAFADSNEECKLVLVVRTDLGMTKGKIAAQASHATLACYKALYASSSPILKRWERLGQAKIAVQVKSEDELEMLQAQAMSMGVCAQVVKDAGRTQIAAGSATVLGVGPAPKSVVDQITGGLKLL